MSPFSRNPRDATIQLQEGRPRGHWWECGRMAPSSLSCQEWRSPEGHEQYKHQKSAPGEGVLVVFTYKSGITLGAL
jgi:hypothetical protein